MNGIALNTGAAPFAPRQYLRPLSDTSIRQSEGASRAASPRAYAGEARLRAPERLALSVADTPLPTEADLDTAPEHLSRMMIHYPGGKAPVDVDIPGMSDKQEIALGLKPVDPANPTGECQTCKQRKYQDGSNDPGVSFKTPTRMDPDKAASAVRGHEQEHVVRERAAASREGRKVVSQSVSIHTAICPECGRVYVSGGLTTTVTAEDNDPSPAEALAASAAGEE